MDNQTSSEKRYIYRILYDIGHDTNRDPLAVYSTIKYTCDSFMQSSEYKDLECGLYEAAEKYIKEHGWSKEVEPVNTLSEDYRAFEDFVFRYNHLNAKGQEFTIDDESLFPGLRNDFIIKLTDTEVEHLGLNRFDREACLEKILSVLRGESLATKDIVFRENETTVTDIELPSEINDTVNAVVFCEDEVYRTCLNRATGFEHEESASYIASNSELMLSINKQIEYGGVVLGMEYGLEYYLVPLSEKEASDLYDLVNREVLCKYGISIPDHFEKLEKREYKKENEPER